MLGLVATVLGLFVVAQLIALTDAGRRLVEESGLTPAEYARSGFFQLCWAIAVLVAFLTLVRGLAAPEVLTTPNVRVLGAIVPVLALGLVVVSLRRMALYDQAFGLTMLRLCVVGAALWMGGTLIMIALRNAGIGASRDWLLCGGGAWALALVVVANVANPEAFVVRHNLARAEAGAPLDLTYLGTLSDDAVPGLADAIERGDHRTRTALRASLRCGDDTTGTAAANWAAMRAAQRRAALCEQ
ncbi:MAG: DUF4153 domain-containing protein [Actinomycetota bacterium]